MDMSHFDQFQDGQECNDHLYSGTLALQKIPEAELPVRAGKISDLYHLIRKTDLFFLNGTEFASDRVDLVLLSADDRFVNGIQFLQRDPCKQLSGIYRLSVLSNFIRYGRIFKEYISCIIHFIF